jgi:ribonuclease BN (tRNA processing enzyme)
VALPPEARGARGRELSVALEWTVLGAGSILPRAGYGCAGYALRAAPGGPVTLFDCGPGTVRALGGAGIELASVRRVVLSHYHPDHCLDLFALAFARRNPAFEPPPLELVGPRGLVGLLERGAALYGARGWTRFEGASVREVEPEAPGRLELEGGGLALAWIATRHTPESVAWRAEAAGLALAYTGDSGENPDVARLAEGADLFVAECSFPDETGVEHHLTPSSAARLARAAGVRRLLLTHFYPAVEPERAREVAARTYAGPIELARDGSVHPLA